MRGADPGGSQGSRGEGYREGAGSAEGRQRPLESTTEPVDAIAARCGFGNAAALRHPFGRRLGTTPLAYRRCFADSC